MAMETLINESKQVYLPLKSLEPSVLNSYEVGDLEDLASSIRSCGILSPLTVVGPNEDGVYEILAGERRYRALSLIQEKDGVEYNQVPCHIVGDSNLDQTIKKLIIEISNLETREFNRDVHRLQVVSLYKELADKGTIEQQDIVRRVQNSLKVSPRYARMYVSIFKNAIPELRAAVETGYVTAEEREKKEQAGEPIDLHIPVHEAARISQFSEEGQKETLDRIRGGEKTQAVIREIAQKENTGKPAAPHKETHTAPKQEPIDQYTDSDIEDEYDDLDSLSGDERLRYDAMAGNDLDLEGDVAGFMRRMSQNMGRVDMNIDTTGQLKGLRSEAKTSDNNVAEEEYRIVSNWLQRMLRKTSFDEESLSPDDAALLQDVIALAEHYESLAN